MSRISSLQDPFLNALRKEKINVSIYLVNGIKLQGIIEAFDQFAIVLRNTVNQMVYKHAVSTIVPAKSVRLVYSSYNPYHQKRNDQNVEEISAEDDFVSEQNITEETLISEEESI